MIMGNLKMIVLIFCLVPLFSNVCFSQEKGNEKSKNKVEQAQEKNGEKGLKTAEEAKLKSPSNISKDKIGKEDSLELAKNDSIKNPEKLKAEKDTANTPQGNAFGKSKADISGKEFGQLRSEEAKNKVNAKRTELDVEIEAAERDIEVMKEKLNKARSRVESLKKENKVAKEEIDQKEAALKKAESKIKELEDRIRSKKQSAVQ